MDKPTLSPQSNRIIEMCKGVLEGKSDPAELSSLLEEVYEGLEKARNDFLTQVEKQGEEYASKMQVQTELVLASFDDFNDALDKISSYYTTHNNEDITQGMDMLVMATNEILDTLTVYEGRSLQLGPTSFPLLNMLILMCDSFKRGDVPADEFRAYIMNAKGYFEKMIEEGTKYKGDKARKPVETLVEGYRKFIDGLTRLDEGAEGGNHLLLDDGLAIIHESQEMMRSGYQAFNYEMFLEGPTDAPNANLLISTIEGFKKGEFPKELLISNLDRFHEDMQELRTDMEGAAKVPFDNPDLPAEVENTLKGLDVADEAVELVQKFLQDNNMALLDSAIAKIKTSVEMLRASQHKFEDISEKELKVTCIKCGYLNPPSRDNCASCGVVLPKTAAPSGASTFVMGEEGDVGLGGEGEFVMTETLAKLVEASAKARDEKITFEEYSVTLNGQEEKLRQLLKDMERPPVSLKIEDYPEDQRGMIQEQLEMGKEIIDLTREGANEYLEGIAEMRLFGEDGDVNHLRAGLELAISGNQKMHQVRKFGDIAKKELSKFESAQKQQGSAAKPKGEAHAEEEAEEDSESVDGYTPSQV
jgi:hypothetical protein